MHYVEKGDHSKPLMVFVHGYPEFWFSWRYQLDYFGKDYWLVVYYCMVKTLTYRDEYL